MANGEGIYETVGMVLEAKDLATPVATRAQTILDSVAAGAEQSFQAVATAAENISAAGGQGAAAAAATVARATGDADARFATLVSLVEGWLRRLQDVVGGFVQKGAINVAAIGKWVRSFADTTVNVAIPVAQAHWSRFVRRGIGAAMAVPRAIIKVLGSEFRRAVSDPVKQFVSKLRTDLVDVYKRVVSINTVVSGIKMALGVVFAPFRLLFRLVEPILDMFVESFMPAIEAFSDIVSNAFAPLAALLEVIATDLAYQIVPLMHPFVNMLMLVAATVGRLIRDTIARVNPVKFAVAVFGFFRRLGPVGAKMMTTFERVVSILAPAVTRFIETAGPAVLDALARILVALLPLIPPLTRIVVAILDKVLLPLVTKLAESVAGFLEKNGPAIEKWLGRVAAYFEKQLIPDLELVWEYIEKEILPDVKKVADAIVEVAKAIAKVYDESDKVVGFWSKHGIGGGLGEFIKTFNPVAEGRRTIEIAREARHAREAREAGKPPKGFWQEFKEGWREFVGFQHGGIVQGPTRALVGEAGPEVILPLKHPVLAEAMRPAFERLEMPGMSESVGILERIERILSGTLRVALVGGERRDDARPTPGTVQWGDERELHDAPSRHGFGGR